MWKICARWGKYAAGQKTWIALIYHRQWRLFGFWKDLLSNLNRKLKFRH